MKHQDSDRRPRWILASSLGLLMTGCCSLSSPVAPPTWLQPANAYPTSRFCSICEADAHAQIVSLKKRLDAQKQCCGSDQVCGERVRQAGLNAWSASIVTYETVRTKLAIADKREALAENQRRIDAIKECPLPTNP
jgi:hypothetical protein